MTVDAQNLETQERECKWCDRGWGAIGLLIGGVIALFALDLLLDGRISELITGHVEIPDSTETGE